MDRVLDQAPVLEGQPEFVVAAQLEPSSDRSESAQNPGEAPLESADADEPISEEAQAEAKRNAEAKKALRQAAKQAKKAAKAAKPAWVPKTAPGAEALTAVELIPAPPSALQAQGQADQADEAASSPFELVPQILRQPLEARGFSSLTTVQSAVLQEAVEGRDLQISSQTGSGKTVALGFVLAPVLVAGPARSVGGPLCLIIVPTRELANQVSEELGWLFSGIKGVRVASVTGGTPMFRDRLILGQRPQVLVGTPGRLLDHIKSGMLDASSIQELVLDEADQMLDMGFREDLEAILDGLPATRRTHMVSATFPEGILRLAERYQKDPVAIEGTPLGDANLDIEHVAYAVDRSLRYSVLVNLLMLGDTERTLVFVERRADAVEVAERLEADGFAAMPLSGELAQTQRERTLAAFRSGKINVLVATDVAARGLDVPDVATVIHTAPPIDSMIYTHRSGRTGRAGKRGQSVLFAPHYRRRHMERMAYDAGVTLKWLPLPNANQVRAQVAAKARAALEADLVAALEAGPAPKLVEQAEALLKDRSPAALVAVLLARLQPARRPEPAGAAQPPPPSSGAPEARRSSPIQRVAPGVYTSERDPGERASDQPERGYERGAGPARFERERPMRRGGAGEPVRFFINWGFNQGVTPGRLLAAVCRRGQVQGGDIGSIAIHPNASTFGVSADVAEQFEELASRRDQRDPQIIIRRDRQL